MALSLEALDWLGSLEDSVWEDASELAELWPDDDSNEELASLDDDASNDELLEEDSAEDELDWLEENASDDELLEKDSEEDEVGWELADDSDEEVICADEDELDDEEPAEKVDDWELADDANCADPNTALNWSSVTQVSPTQIFFALILSCSKTIPSVVINLLTIQEKRPRDGSLETVELVATLACKSLILIFNSCMALARREVNFG